MFCLHILNMCENDYLAPTTVSMEIKLFKSEYGLCMLKIQNSKLRLENIFAYKMSMLHYQH